MVSEGIPLRRIASLLGVSHDTLTRRFAKLVKPVTQKRDGRPQKELDPKKVRQLASYGLTPEEVGAMLDCDRTTIMRRFAQDFESGETHRNGKLKAELIRRALKGSDTLLMFACKSLCGLSDKPENDRLPNGDSIAFLISQFRSYQQLPANGQSIPKTAIERFAAQFDHSPTEDIDADTPSPHRHSEPADVPSEGVFTQSNSPLA